MSEKREIRYDNSAEQRTVTGWCCTECNHFWGNDEHMARFCCCTTQACQDCGQDTKRHFVRCRDCQDKFNTERFQKLEQRDYDGRAALCQWDGDQFFYDEDSVLFYIGELDDPAKARLVFAELRKPRWNRTVAEELCDDLYEDCDWDTKEIDQQIEKWVDENAPNVYWGTSVRLSDKSLAEMVAEVIRDRDLEAGI